MKEKMKLRLYLVLLVVTVFTVVSISYVVLSSGIPYVLLYSVFPLLIVIFLLGHYIVEPIEDRIGRKRVFLIIFSAAVIALIFIDSATIVASPNWAFTISTDKRSYKLGEEVHITVSLENQGFIAHSFESGLSDPIVVSIEYQYTDNPFTTQVWYNHYNEDPTVFSIQPGQFLERVFLWNQTNTVNPWLWNMTCRAGTYQIWALIPRVNFIHPTSNPLFRTWTTINVTSN